MLPASAEAILFHLPLVFPQDVINKNNIKKNTSLQNHFNEIQLIYKDSKRNGVKYDKTPSAQPF